MPPSSPAPEPLAVTARQLELLRLLRSWSGVHGRMPSVRELAAELKRSASTVHQHLRALERRGCLERTGAANGIRLLVADEQLGLPDDAPKDLMVRGILHPGRHLRWLPPPAETLPAWGESRRGDYALEVEGDRLQAEGIFHGDLVVVRPGAAWNRPAVVQYLDGTLDIKRVTMLRDGTLAVWSARPGLTQRRGTRRAPGVMIQGRVLRVIRRFE